jgi:reactive intermediate/imine deaminase
MHDVSSGKNWEALAPYSQGKKIDPQPLIFLSGQVSIDEDGNIIGVGDLREQTRRVFANISDLLAAAGSSLNKVVKITYFVTDMQNWSVVHEVRKEFFPTHKPASTTVEVSRLHKPEYLIEVEVIALAH